MRAQLEPRFGYSFADVRIHTDSRAAVAARSVNALAYTYGRNIVFGAGQYAPNSPGGRRLLAHELTHVVQQSPSIARLASPISAGSPVPTVTRAPGRAMVHRWEVCAKNPGINTIVCDGGGGIRVQLGATGNANQTRCLSACMRTHEQSHRADALTSNAKVCDGAGAGKVVCMSNAAEQKASEFKASQAEIDCLNAAKGAADATCKPIIEARIPQMEAYRDSFK